MGAGMQAAAIGMSVVGLAALASSKAARQQRRSTVVGRRVAGVCLPLTEKWDPLKLGSTDAKMERYTAVEIKHGRISMIATIGYVMPEIFRFPGCENFTNGLGALGTIPLEGWVQLVVFIGAHEVLVKPRAGGMGAYDFGLGTELLDGISDEELERRQTVERNNGRLAMVAILGLMWQDGQFGIHPLQLLKTEGFWGPNLDWMIRNLTICGDGGGVTASFCAVRPRGRGVVTQTALRATMRPAVFKNESQAILDARELARAVGVRKRGDVTEHGEKLLKE